MYEETQKQIGTLLRDYLLRNRWTKRAYIHSHFGWSRWQRCIRDGRGTPNEYQTILMAIHMVDKQHYRSCSEETLLLTDQINRLIFSLPYEDMDKAIQQNNQYDRHKHKQQRRL